MRILRSLLIVIFLFQANQLFGDQIPEPLAPPQLVNDFVGTLHSSDKRFLENKLRKYHDTTTTQIYVIITNDLAGYDISDYAQRLGQKWGVGQKGKDNGIIIVVKPKSGISKGRAFIATGYEIEGAIPDAVARRIVDNIMLPYFKDNKYGYGLNEGINAIIDILSGQNKAGKYSNKKKGSSDTLPVIIAIIVGIIVICSGFQQSSKTGKITYRADIPLYIIFNLLLRGGGGYKNFSSGSGGFKGGGGGSFGGGGAGGSW